MKQIRHILFTLSVIALAACQTIAEDDRLIAIDNPALMQRRVLLTEFSGIGCMNCPTAHALTEQLIAAGDTTIVIVQMHPATNAFTESADPLYDYTSEAADEYYRYFGGTASTPLPTGVVDFLKTDNRYFTDYTEWATRLLRRRTEKARADLKCQIEQKGKQYTLNATVTNLQADSHADLRLLCWLVEDSIRGIQVMPDGTVNNNYPHRHILRKAIGNIWGEQHSLQPSQTSTIKISISTTDLPSAENMSVVCVVLAADKSEVLAVEQLPLKAEQPADKEPFLLTLNMIGAISHDTTIVITETADDPITAKKVMELRGTISLTKHITIDVERSAGGLSDQLCVGTCVNGNKLTAQQFSFNLADGFSTWYAHYYPADNTAQTITYTWKNSQRQLRLSVVYKP